MSMLYLGHWDDAVAAGWADELESTGRISLDFVAYTSPVMAGWLNTGNITTENDSGHIFVFLNGATPGTALDGITASLSDGSGTVVYWGADGRTLNPVLTASSATGHKVIANVPPGTYTLNIETENLVCNTGFAWMTDTPNQYTVPVQANTVTRTGAFCTQR